MTIPKPVSAARKVFDCELRGRATGEAQRKSCRNGSPRSRTSSRHFVQQFSRRNNRSIETIPSDTIDALVHYPWPGNIRELQNVIERGVIVSRGPILRVPIADFKAHTARAAIAKPVKPASTLRDTLGETERNQILKALEQSQWVIAGPKGAAARLGMKRSTLQFRMRKLGIRIARTRA